MCSGGIIGMGESDDDRCEMLRTLANLEPRSRRASPSTRSSRSRARLAANAKPVDPLDLVRMIAVARILMPKSRVRLSAGRESLSREAQMLCMLAGANSIFYGEKLLTTPNPEADEDPALIPGCGSSDDGASGDGADDGGGGGRSRTSAAALVDAPREVVVERRGREALAYIVLEARSLYMTTEPCTDGRWQSSRDEITIT